MKFDASKLQKKDLGQYFELFTPDIRSEQELCNWAETAKKYDMRSYIVHPMWVKETRKLLDGTNIKLGTGCCFPMGTDMPEAKGYSAKLMVDSGVDTFDCSMNYRALYSGHPELVDQEMKLVKEACKDIECKFIIEVAFLTDEQIVEACKMCMDNGIDWVKTSSGQFQGPNMDQVKLILDTLKGSNTRCKVSGVKYPRPQNAYSFLNAGVEIIGTQGVVEIIESFDMFRELGLLPEYAG